MMVWECMSGIFRRKRGLILLELVGTKSKFASTATNYQFTHSEIHHKTVILCGVSSSSGVSNWN